VPAVYEAVVCDLLSAPLDSWNLWHRVAGSVDEGRGWRIAFLDRVSGGEPYRPDTYALALSELGVASGRALYVAGAPYVVAGGHAAGMSVVWHDRARLRSDEDLPALP
jgi:hypothetical protein